VCTNAASFHLEKCGKDLPAQQPDALPQRLQHIIEGLDAVWCSRLSQCRHCERCDRLDLIASDATAQHQTMATCGSGKHGSTHIAAVLADACVNFKGSCNILHEADLLVLIRQPVLHDVDERLQVWEDGTAQQDGNLLHDLDACMPCLQTCTQSQGVTRLALASSLQHTGCSRTVNGNE
jgi:hypothetical protein